MPRFSPTPRPRPPRRGLALLFLDGEILLDGSQAILQAVHWADCDATLLFEELSARHGLAVKLADLTTTPQAGRDRLCYLRGREVRLRLVRDRRGVLDWLVLQREPSSRPTS